MWFCSQEPWIIRASGSLSPPHRELTQLRSSSRESGLQTPSASKPFINSSCSSGPHVGVWGPPTVAFYRLCFNCRVNIWVRCGTGEPHAWMWVCRLTVMERRRRTWEDSANQEKSLFCLFNRFGHGDAFLFKKKIINAYHICHVTQ